MNVCDNLGDHLVGNVFVKFKREEDAEKAVADLNNRWWEIHVNNILDFREFSPLPKAQRGGDVSCKYMCNKYFWIRDTIHWLAYLISAVLSLLWIRIRFSSSWSQSGTGFNLKSRPNKKVRYPNHKLYCTFWLFCQKRSLQDPGLCPLCWFVQPCEYYQITIKTQFLRRDKKKRENIFIFFSSVSGE